ncbi:MAG TPA: ATP-binding SpoIIE family protein phosphatase [Gemmatimonadaceae bacterium]|nr:ATP-binding SpoIIE family protein phosphatase [Gemmatimonadaceae bacterium]
MEIVAQHADGGNKIVAVEIADSSQVGEARRTASKLAAEAGLDETEAGRVALIVTELGTNILKHAKRGEMIVRSVGTRDRAMVELVAIDTGPGIADLDRALRDGYSTAGSPGAGLGALMRVASSFDVYSVSGRGTVIVARVVRQAKPTLKPLLDVGVIRVPKAGEAVCGDDFSLTIRPSGAALLVVADGLGHGISAADASSLAARIAAERPDESPVETISAIHGALRSTRGAAAAAAAIDADARSIRYSGIGNISASIVLPGSTKTLVSHNGIVGHSARHIQEFAYPWPEGALLVMHSDGISGRWDLDAYPGIMSRDPSIIAGVIYRDFTRHRDDAIVIVTRAVSRS